MKARRDIYKLVGGAIGLSIVSRLLGLAREAVIVGRIGVHDYTDAYFATSTLILWLQNWSFGAWSLYFVPKYLSLSAAEREGWVGARVRRALAYSAVAVLLFLAFYPAIEALMLGGRRVLGTGEAAVLAVSLPATAVAGVYYGRLIASPAGIYLAARGLLFANVAGFGALLGVLFVAVPRSYVLPITLSVTQVATLVALARATRRSSFDAEAAGKAGAALPQSQVTATTLENVTFNVNALVHQTVAGWLPAGTVTVNAYLTRLLLLPVTGLMGPIQQRLMQHFASDTPHNGLRKASRGTIIALAAGASIGLLGLVVLSTTVGFWPRAAALMIARHHLPQVALLYGCYAGVLFSNGVIARWYFANGGGWTYAVTMIAGYGVGSLTKIGLAAHLGLPALPLGALAGEGSALLALHLVARRRHLGDAGPAAPPAVVS